MELPKDTSVYDFIPSQPSPAKSKKRSKSAKSTTKTTKANTKTNKERNSVPRKNSKAALARKQELIKQLNEDWGIEPQFNNNNNDISDDGVGVADGDAEPPPLSQATVLRNHIEEIDSSVTLLVEKEPPKRRCRFVTPSTKKGDKPVESAIASSSVSKQEVPRLDSEQFKEKVSQACPSSAELQRESLSRKKAISSSNVDNSGNVIKTKNTKRQKVKRAEDEELKKSNDIDQPSSVNISTQGQVDNAITPENIKTEIGPDEDSSSAIQVQRKTATRRANKTSTVKQMSTTDNNHSPKVPQRTRGSKVTNDAAEAVSTHRSTKNKGDSLVTEFIQADIRSFTSSTTSPGRFRIHITCHILIAAIVQILDNIFHT